MPPCVMQVNPPFVLGEYPTVPISAHFCTELEASHGAERKNLLRAGSEISHLISTSPPRETIIRYRTDITPETCLARTG